MFISYVREDRERVNRLQVVLERAGITVWRDTADLWPGQDWKIEIARAITAGSLAFIACFSENTDAKVTSYQNEELSLAVEQLRCRVPGRAWLIPVRFAECPVPPFDLGAGRTLGSLQHIDLFDGGWELGLARLVSAVLRISHAPAVQSGPRPSPVLPARVGYGTESMTAPPGQHVMHQIPAYSPYPSNPLPYSGAPRPTSTQHPRVSLPAWTELPEAVAGVVLMILRGVQFSIDWFLTGIVPLVVVGSTFQHGKSDIQVLGIVAAVAIGLPIYFWYWVIWPYGHYGQTFAMRIIGLQVLGVDGTRASKKQLFYRAVLLIIDCIFYVGPILMLVSRGHQRVGDYMAKTVVVPKINAEQPAG